MQHIFVGPGIPPRFLVSIDLAEVLTWKGEIAQTTELATQCCSILKSWGLHRDALAAWARASEDSRPGNTESAMSSSGSSRTLGATECYRRYSVALLQFVRIGE